MVEDRANYESFLQVFNSLYHNHVADFFPGKAMAYADWAQVNIAVNDQPSAVLDANSRPNRRSSGNPGSPSTGFSNWPENGRLSNVPANSRFAVFNDLEGARNFLNCCEDLSVLARELDQVKTESSFKELLGGMTVLAQETGGPFPVFYTKPMLAAFFDLMDATVVRLDVPSDDMPRDVFAIRIDLA